MGVLTTAFVDVTYEIASSDPPMFETHFKHAYTCASLNNVEGSACWPLFNVSYVDLVVLMPKGKNAREQRRNVLGAQSRMTFVSTRVHHSLYVGAALIFSGEPQPSLVAHA